MAFCIFAGLLGVTAILTVDKKSERWQRASNAARVLAETLGAPHTIYSVVIAFALFAFHSSSPKEFGVIVAAWVLTGVLSPLEGSLRIGRRLKRIFKPNTVFDADGEVVAYQTPGLILVRQSGSAKIESGDVVAVHDSLGQTRMALALDHVGRDEGMLLRTIEIADAEVSDELREQLSALLPDSVVRVSALDEIVRHDGKRVAGLFRYLRTLTSSNGDDRRDVIATVFKGVDSRMRSGYLLRDVINKVAGIHFTSSAELLTLGALYESMLREMRDAAGDSGEFYTPRAVVRFMVTVTDPRLGKTVLDPACGTGGFLVEAFNHLSRQVKTVADRRVLQTQSLFGCEPKPLPYLLCQMNLLLHGLDAPQIDPGNALRHKLTDIGERDRVDVILTNPPFGGEEERGIQGNFPEDKQTAETALLFLQLIMRKLHRVPSKAGESARAAVVVPNGTITHLPPAQLAAQILKKEQRIAEIVGNIQKLVTRED
jgi:hypothetical protein